MGYQIGKKTFKTKATMKDYFGYILRNEKEGTILEKQYAKDVRALLDYHPEKDEKIGKGVKFIRIERHIDSYSGYPSNSCHFHIHRKDGTDIDFSYNACIANMGKATPNWARMRAIDAFRNAIRPQIDLFRNRAFGKKTYIKCPELGVNFSKKTCHIDHKFPKTFASILNKFIDENKLTLDMIKVEKSDEYTSSLEDMEFLSLWYKFHAENADLRAIHKTANISMGKSKPINL